MTAQTQPALNTEIEPQAAIQDQSAGDSVPASGGNAGKKSPSAFRTISEVAEGLKVQQHVLRFWETKFSQIRPLKRGGGRRYYRPEDVAILKTIHNLLYSQGYTIRGVQKLFREQGKSKVVEKNPVTVARNNNTRPASSSQAGISRQQRTVLQSVLEELRALRGLVDGD